MTEQTCATAEHLALAARWWTDQLAGIPIFKSDHEVSNETATLIAARSDRPTLPQLLAFYDALLAELRAQVADCGYAGRKHPDWARCARASTDYEPDRVLSLALARAGIDPESLTLLPWKTHMSVRPSGVEVNGRLLDS